MLFSRCYLWLVFVYFSSPNLFQNGVNLTLFQVHSVKWSHSVKGSKNFFHPNWHFSIVEGSSLPMKMKWVTCQNQLSEKTPLYSSKRIGITLSITEIKAPLRKFVSTPVKTKRGKEMWLKILPLSMFPSLENMLSKRSSPWAKLTDRQWS